MPTWNHLGTWELDAFRQTDQFRTRVRTASLSKLERRAHAFRNSLRAYERDPGDRRNPRDFLAGWEKVKEEARVVEAEIRIRKLGAEGPFR